MKKIILILILSISLISFVRALPVSLDSVIDSQSLTQINDNINFIKENYDADIKIIISDTGDSVTKEALDYFDGLWILQKNKNEWNSLVYYNENQNKLRFVTRKECDFVYNYLKKLKEKDFIKNVLNEKNPTNGEISNMLLQISIDFKNTAQSFEGNTCPANSIGRKLQLRSKEYSVPAIVLRVVYAISQNTNLEGLSTTTVLGYYITGGLTDFFDFLPFIDSKTKKFYNMLEQNTDFSKIQIDNYYNIINTKGDIVVNEDRLDQFDSTLFHERVHKILTEELTSQETQTLINAQRGFLAFLKNGEDVNYRLIGRDESSAIYQGNWQELYAHMASLEKYPYDQYYDRYIDEEVYTLFASKYPDAYKIYQKVYDLAS